MSLARSHTTKLDWQASIRARLGIAVDRALIYVSGGVAFADVKHTISLTPAVLPYHSYGSMRTGWTAGAGLEYAFTNNRTGRVDYRYADYGETNATTIANNANDRSRLTTHAVRVGISHKFRTLSGGRENPAETPGFCCLVLRLSLKRQCCGSRARTGFKYRAGRLQQKPRAPE